MAALRKFLILAAILAALPAGAASAPAPAAEPDSAALRAAAADSLAEAAEPDEDQEEETDTGVASGGKPGLPFATVKPTRKEIASFQTAVMRAKSAMAKKNYAQARRILSATEPTERLAQVYRSILFSDVYIGLKDYARADSVLEACLAWVGGSVWQSYLYNRRIQLFPLTEPGDSARLEFSTRVIQAPVSKAVKVNFHYSLLQLRGFAGKPAGFEPTLKRIAATAPADRRLDSLYRFMSPGVPPGSGTWELQELMLSLETKLGLHDQAIVRSEAALGLVKGKAEKQRLHWSIANLYYRKKDYPKALAAFESHMKAYGETPDGLLQMARSFDRMREPKKAAIWYDRLLEKYPKHDKTSEIYWLRGWELEQAGNYEEAIEFYYRQLADFSRNRRGDWANFRVGLCQYKSGNTAAALQAFKAIRSQVNSNAYPAGLFWEAKMMSVLGDTAGARTVLRELASKHTLNFYAHLGRQVLTAQGAMPDSLEPWRRFAPSTPDAIQAWMKAEMSTYRGRLNHEYESEYLGMGKLLQFQMDTLAILTLKTIPARIKNDPWFLYIHARMFKNRHLWREAYRIGLQLSYKIPSEKWGAAPKEVLRLIYPRPYEGLVQKYAAKRGLDPAFIYALMRQESGFDREIKSRAGAVGLMQIMPATGKAVAKQEGWPPFDPFRLTEAEVNVSLGTAYLRDLRKDYQGNEYWVLANYNAGPTPTRRWMGQAADRPLEEVIEDISYWETRDYVKKVMGNYFTYRILWNNRKPPATTVSTD